MSNDRPDSPMRLALKARENRLRRGVEEMQWQVRRFRRTVQKINGPTSAAPADPSSAAPADDTTSQPERPAS